MEQTENCRRMSREMVLRQYLSTVADRYDYALIDCMPSLGMLTINALTAADSVIIPVQAQYLPAKGLEQLLRTITRVKRQLNPKLEVDGIVLTMVDSRTTLAREINALVRKTYGGHVCVGNSAYHICEFAEMQERSGNTYVPRTLKISAEIGTYEIYQIPAIADVDYCFRPYAEAKGKLQNADYQRSYAGMFAKENSLEHLWTKHNSDHRPFARRMRSMSVSDIVVLTQGGKKTAYYADTFGFKEVPEFLEQPQKAKNKQKERGEAR